MTQIDLQVAVPRYKNKSSSSFMFLIFPLMYESIFKWNVTCFVCVCVAIFAEKNID